MNLAEFRGYIARATLGDRQPLREAARLMAKCNAAVDVFTALGQDGIETLIQTFLKALPPGERRPALMESAATLARDILFALARLHLDFKDEGFPFVPTPEIKRLLPLPLDRRPQSLNTAVENWTPRIAGEGPSVGVGKPLSAETPPRYRTKLWQYGAIVVQSGAVLQEGMTISAFTSQVVFDIVMLRLEQHFSEGTIPSFLSAIKRIVADTLGKDHPNVGVIASAIKERSTKQALSAKTIEDLRDLTGGEAVMTGRLTVWEVPGAILERAKVPGLRKCDVDCRLACAVAVAISLQLLAADAEFLGTLNLDKAVRSSGDVLWLDWRDQSGRKHSIEMDEPCRSSIIELLSFRERTGRSTPWLFPNRTRKAARLPRAAMEFVATNIEAVLGRRLTLVDLQDATAINAIDTGEADLNEISDARGAKYVKSTRSRFHVALNATLNKKSGRNR